MKLSKIAAASILVVVVLLAGCADNRDARMAEQTTHDDIKDEVRQANQPTTKYTLQDIDFGAICYGERGQALSILNTDNLPDLYERREGIEQFGPYGKTLIANSIQEPDDNPRFERDGYGFLNAAVHHCGTSDRFKIQSGEEKHIEIGVELSSVQYKKVVYAADSDVVTANTTERCDIYEDGDYSVWVVGKEAEDGSVHPEIDDFEELDQGAIRETVYSECFGVRR